MISNRLLFLGLFLVVFLCPQALKSQSHFAIESVVLHTYSQTADFTLTLQSKDLNWKVSDSGTSNAELLLVTASFDKSGDVLVYQRETRTVTADTEDPVKLAAASTSLLAKVRITAKTNRVRFEIESLDKKEIAAFEVDRKTIYSAGPHEDPPALPCRFRGLCQP
jgi:hypothetical protein